MHETLSDIKNYWEAVRRRKWLVILPAVLCTVASLFIAVRLPSYYRSTTVILVEQQQIPEAYVTPTDRTPFGQRLQTIRQQILSKPRLDKIINDLHLYQGGGNGVSSMIKKALGMKTASATSREAILEGMTRDIEVNVIGGQRGDAFSISYTGTDPYTVMQVTSTLTSLFIEENLKVREQYAEGTSEFLANELEGAKKELEAQERAVRTFKEKFMGGLPQQLETNLRTLDRLQMDMQNVRTDIKNAEDRKILLESQLNQISSGTTEAPGVVVDPLAAELARLQRDLSTLLATYKENYPDVITTRRRINEVKQLISRPREAASEKTQDGPAVPPPDVLNPTAYNNLVTVRSQLATLRHREAEITKQIRFFEKRVEDTPATEQKFADLRRDYDISLRNYQTLLEKKLHAKLSENLEKRQKGERFTVIDPANLPERPFKPNRPAVALLGPLGGLGVGVGIVFLIEFLNPAFRKPEDFEGVLQIKVLSTIPEFSMTPSADSKKR
jgi:polysaccharide chain length determinant protein (PEP-CTERM system associated)